MFVRSLRRFVYLLLIPFLYYRAANGVRKRPAEHSPGVSTHFDGTSLSLLTNPQPDGALLYGQTEIGPQATETVFPNQTLTVVSPTPYLGWGDMEMWTSSACGTALPSGIIPGSGEYDFSIDGPYAIPFPEGDYSNWNFVDWASSIGANGEDGEHGYSFQVPAFAETYLKQLPLLSSQYSAFAQCTPIIANGDPTVSWPAFPWEKKSVTS